MKNTDSELKNKIEYIIAVISEFAAAHSLNTSQAYRYLERFKGIDFVNRFYNVEHTLSFEDVKGLMECCLDISPFATGKEGRWYDTISRF